MTELSPGGKATRQEMGFDLIDSSHMLLAVSSRGMARVHLELLVSQELTAQSLARIAESDRVMKLLRTRLQF